MTFHRTRRNASRLESELKQIPGVGEKTTMKLLRHFGSLERVREASDAALRDLMGPATASKVRAAIGNAPVEAGPQVKS